MVQLFSATYRKEHPKVFEWVDYAPYERRRLVTNIAMKNKRLLKKNN